MSETLLGFQLRIDPRCLQAWDATRRTRYLLKESIDKPLSVDVVVWPLSKDESLSMRIFENYETDPAMTPNGLDVYRLKSKEFLSEKYSQKDSLLTAITSFGDAAIELKARHAIENVDISVSELRNAGWSMLGLDVADYWLVSALANCGYDPHEKSVYSSRFAGLLNSHGLFDNINDATQFCGESSNRVPEHAPFATYGVWSKTT